MQPEHSRAGGPNDSCIIHDQKVDDGASCQGTAQFITDNSTLMTFKYEPKVVTIDLTSEMQSRDKEIKISKKTSIMRWT